MAKGRGKPPGANARLYAEGYLGPYLVVVPGKRLVAVRQLRPPPSETAIKDADAFRDFPTMVLALVE